MVGGVAFQLAASLGLFAWGRWVARRHSQAGWRYAAWAPLVAGGLGAIGTGLTVAMLVRSFAEVGRLAPEDKARTLAEGISEAMNVGSFFILPSSVLYTVCFATFLVGSLRSPAAP
jgi:hypothetical protein